MFDQSRMQPGELSEHGAVLAYAFYRRALHQQMNGNAAQATADLGKARQFSGVPARLMSLVRQRATAVRGDTHREISGFDKVVAERFERSPKLVELREEFLERYGLTRAKRRVEVEGIDEISSVGVYRWAGDRNRGDQWSRLIRRFKGGDPVLPAFFGRILAEHVRATPLCKAWLAEVDYVVPVPAAARRTAERGIDIVAEIAKHLGWRLGIPVRADLLRRKEGSERSRDVGRTELASQYGFNEKKAADVRGRTAMLVDDVMNRAHARGLARRHPCGGLSCSRPAFLHRMAIIRGRW